MKESKFNKFWKGQEVETNAPKKDINKFKKGWLEGIWKSDVTDLQDMVMDWFINGDANSVTEAINLANANFKGKISPQTIAVVVQRSYQNFKRQERDVLGN